MFLLSDDSGEIKDDASVDGVSEDVGLVILFGESVLKIKYLFRLKDCFEFYDESVELAVDWFLMDGELEVGGVSVVGFGGRGEFVDLFNGGL